MKFIDSAKLLAQCVDLCAMKYPLETGGLFLGFRTNSHNLSISKIIGPGPDAIHRRYSFEPDHEWQNEQIAEYYRETKRRAIIVGDWHSHPNATYAAPSSHDKKMARKLIRHSDFRNPSPLISIFYGKETNWGCKSWVAKLTKCKIFGFRKIVFDEITIIE